MIAHSERTDHLYTLIVAELQNGQKEGRYMIEKPEVYNPNRSVIYIDELSPEQLYRVLADGFDEIAVSRCIPAH